MTYRYVVETDYRADIPSTGVPGGLQPRGIVEHWTAGAPGRAGALATTRFFVEERERNASYHALVWWEPGTLGVRWIVPPSRASHSMNPARPPSGPYDPTPEVRRILGDRWADPNGVSLAVAFCGMPADLAAALRDPAFRAGYGRFHRELMQTTSLADRPLFNHGWAQPSTRSDAGDALIPAIYALLAEPAPEDDMDLAVAKHQRYKVVRIRGGATLYRTPAGSEVHFQVPAGPGFDAELFLELSGRFLCRRLGADGAFFVGADGIDRTLPFRTFELIDPRREQRLLEARTAITTASEAIDAAIA